jgi:hypothetical protein
MEHAGPILMWDREKMPKPPIFKVYLIAEMTRIAP